MSRFLWFTVYNQNAPKHDTSQCKHYHSNKGKATVQPECTWTPHINILCKPEALLLHLSAVVKKL